MPDWRARVAGPERDLRFLLDRLRGPDCRVTEDEGKFHLRSRLFEALGGAGEVKRVADEIIARANLAALLDFAGYRGVCTERWYAWTRTGHAT